VVTRHRPHPLGVHPRSGGVDAAVLASHAERVDLCLLDQLPDGSWHERRVPLPHLTHGVWHGFVPDVPIGQRYGFRAHGRWEPHRGLRYNPAKLLLDPYARAIGGGLNLRPELYGQTVDAALCGDIHVVDTRDSALFVPHGVVADPNVDWGDDRLLDIPWADTVIYEVHVRGFTQRMPEVPDRLRGTYAGLAHPAAVEYLVNLGITAVELLPVHTIGSEPGLVRRGMPNYWGYSTLGFFAPHAGYAAAEDPLAVLDEFRDMVRTLHAAGIEVILDVVYNHTCESGVDGPLLSWRGLDGPVYYRLDAHGHDDDSTGCGNSLDFSRARVVQMTLDSLRYWVEYMHVDGFRFDLATTLARGREGFDPDHPFLVAVRADPVLNQVKLIAEPWDVGPHGWRTGQFPAPFAEWNDRFRDTIRDFWLAGAARETRGGPAGGVRDLATRLAGSADVFAQHRGPLGSINFVTSHDGFTLADCTTYEAKHNEENGEDNRDGTTYNRTWNHGVEGPTDDEEILAQRRQAMRNMLGTLLLATGVPMVLGGDEFGRTQGGNNNAYCQDNEISWLDWDLQPWQEDLIATTAHLLHLRREHPVLGQERFFAGRPVHLDGTKDLAWFAPDGHEMVHDRWHDPGLRTLQMYLHAVEDDGSGHHTDESLLIVVQGGAWPAEVVLPGPPWARAYRLLWDSAEDRPPDPDDPECPEPELVDALSLLTVSPRSLRVYGVVPLVSQEGQD
jgi:glycogen operon protein